MGWHDEHRCNTIATTSTGHDRYYRCCFTGRSWQFSIRQWSVIVIDDSWHLSTATDIDDQSTAAAATGTRTMGRRMGLSACDECTATGIAADLCCHRCEKSSTHLARYGRVTKCCTCKRMTSIDICIISMVQGMVTMDSRGSSPITAQNERHKRVEALMDQLRATFPNISQ